MIISAACRKPLGDWDESFFLYSEEVDYCRQRVRLVTGCVTFQVPSPAMLEASTGRAVSSGASWCAVALAITASITHRRCGEPYSKPV